MISTDTAFYVTGGSMRVDAASYVERKADRDLLEGLLQGEFCYVLTSRQMGKSSLMVRTAKKLRECQVRVVTLDLTAIGQNLTLEQWYDGLLLRLGQQLQMEHELDECWQSKMRLGPVQRFFSVLQERVLTPDAGPIVIFVDEIDVVKSLPFVTDEFFAAIRECANRRTENPQFNQITFCLLGVAVPAELIRDPATTPFNIGKRIELTDFTLPEASPLARRLGPDTNIAEHWLERMLYWTNGHPYLTQRFCRVVAETDPRLTGTDPRKADVSGIDSICERIFLSSRAREQDDNLLFVRERIIRTEADLGKLLALYARIHKGERVHDDETDDLINQLRLAGIVNVHDEHLRVRNRIYHQVFDLNWVAAIMPDAELEKPDGQRLRIQSTCTLGRASGNDVVLSDPKVSRRHTLIQVQKQYEFWLIDLGSANGTFLNGHRVTQPVRLRNQDQIEVGPFRLVFRQSQSTTPAEADQTNLDRTIFRARRD